MLGIAVGVIGLSYVEFCRLEPYEFSYIYEAYSDERAERDQADWERMRMLASITIQPHVKNRVIPRKLLEFPWEKKALKHNKPDHPVSKEDSIRRFESLLKRVKD